MKNNYNYLFFIFLFFLLKINNLYSDEFIFEAPEVQILDNGNKVIASDIKPKEYWFQDFEKAENYYATDMKDMNNCTKVTKDVDYVFNMACNMGGMGFIENTKTIWKI